MNLEDHSDDEQLSAWPNILAPTPILLILFGLAFFFWLAMNWR